MYFKKRMYLRYEVSQSKENVQVPDIQDKCKVKSKTFSTRIKQKVVDLSGDMVENFIGEVNNYRNAFSAILKFYVICIILLNICYSVLPHLLLGVIRSIILVLSLPMLFFFKELRSELVYRSTPQYQFRGVKWLTGIGETLKTIVQIILEIVLGPVLGHSTSSFISKFSVRNAFIKHMIWLTKGTHPYTIVQDTDKKGTYKTKFGQKSVYSFKMYKILYQESSNLKKFNIWAFSWAIVGWLIQYCMNKLPINIFIQDIKSIGIAIDIYTLVGVLIYVLCLMFPKTEIS
jgi:hypothetical protein